MQLLIWNNYENKEDYYKFPKKRPSISSNLEKIYAEQYKKNRDGKTLASFVPQKLESWVWLLAPRNAHGVRGENDQKDFLKTQKLYSKGWGDKSKIKIEIIEGGHEYFIDSL